MYSSANFTIRQTNLEDGWYEESSRFGHGHSEGSKRICWSCWLDLAKRGLDENPGEVLWGHLPVCSLLVWTSTKQGGLWLHSATYYVVHKADVKQKKESHHSFFIAPASKDKKSKFYELETAHLLWRASSHNEIPPSSKAGKSLFRFFRKAKSCLYCTHFSWVTGGCKVFPWLVLASHDRFGDRISLI